MRIAIVGDSHFDEHNRLEECVRIHDWIATDLIDREVDLLLHSGDLYERRSTPTERLAAARWLTRVASHCSVVVARGNHDAVGDVQLLGDLRTRNPVRVVEGYEEIREAGMDLAVMAWPRKAHAEAFGADATEAMRAMLRHFGARHSAQPRILLAHAMVRGSRTSTGQELIGCDLEVGLEDLALARADLYALGHIHAHQSWTIGGAPVIYPGSPRRANFGELEPKGYVVADVCRDGVSWEFVETPATPMLHATGTWDGSRFGVSVDGRELRGAEVRLRYSVPSDQREAARRAALRAAEELRAAGAASVRLEEMVEAVTRARDGAAAIASAPRIADKLGAMWAGRGMEPARQAELGRKLAALEGGP